ncbi:carbonic anhydrase [Pilimelia terevasa]|uniref:Carbonic anhydrase n=1 Tax=Pilimelia terevasa TaxID=53372 RepID=A0A8J3BHS8_9ACTN|nr:carbonic anhydrase [Pilimelia terevasa]GGK22459.1 carbonic anhydrase [Pilimelia terevasa]
MQTFIAHARTFPHRVGQRRHRFARLASGQRPQALFISCSDSRVVPALITAAEPGDIFELRSVGNIVPPYRPDAACAVASAVEFAVASLDVSDIVVCGHSHCGAVQAMTEGTTLPSVGRWLAHAAHRPAPTADPVAVTQQHILTQLAHLRRYPVVAARLGEGRLRLHAWYYTVDTGEVLAHRPGTADFGPL